MVIDQLFGKIIIPIAYYIRGDTRFKYYNLYKNNLKKSRKEIEAYRLRRLKKLINHSYETVPYYRELFDKHNIKPGDIKTLDDLKKIPPLDKKTINNNLEKLKSKKKYKLTENFSGGSSGNRVIVYNDKRYLEISRAAWMRDLSSVGIQPGQKVAWLWGSDMETKPIREQIWHKLLWNINRRILFNTFNYTEEKLKNWLLKEFNRYKPDYIYGYSGSLYEIAKFIKKNNLKIHQLKKIISTAEKLENKEFIEEVFNCKVIDHYGCREVVTIAIDDSNSVMHSSDDFVIIEIGKNNELILTPLELYGMPLLRYVNGDIGTIINNESKKDNHPFNQFNITVGRITEVFYNKKQERIKSPMIGHIAGEMKLNIGEFQIVQRSIDLLEINIIKDKNFKKADVEKLKKIIRGILGDVKFDINYLNNYPIEKSGKKINYKCLIQDEDITNQL